MAIYQLYLSLIPQVEVSKMTNSMTIEKCWETIEINPYEIIDKVDQYLDRADWGNDKVTNHWKTYTEEVDNDAWLLLDEHSGKITEFGFRADLRENKLVFLKNMLLLARDYDLLLMDRKGNIANPEIDEVGDIIEKSNAFRFVSNPRGFLQNLADGRLNLE